MNEEYLERLGDYDDRIDLMIKNYQIGYKFPPVLALKDGTIIDGAHRVIAARRLNIKIGVVYIDAIIEEVDPNKLKSWIDK